MALKTFNLDKKVYSEFSKHCKKHGMSMSKKVENFIREEMIKLKNQGMTIKRHDLGDLDLDVDKDTRPKPHLSLERKDHSMDKYC